MVKYGLADTVFDRVTQALEQFDAAVEQGMQGQAHVGASAELDTMADEVVQVMKVMDGLNRSRFAKDAESLPAWASASKVLAKPRPAAGLKPAPETLDRTVPAGVEIRPAAWCVYSSFTRLPTHTVLGHQRSTRGGGR